MSDTEWTADDVMEVLIDVAMDLALGVYGDADSAAGIAATYEVRARLGREMTAAELREWLDTCAEARRQVAASRALRSVGLLSIVGAS